MTPDLPSGDGEGAPVRRRRRRRRRRGAAPEPAAPQSSASSDAARPAPAARPPAPEALAARRRWPLGTLLVFVIGVWAGRVFAVLPRGVEDVLGVVLALATALLVAALYRRWVRGQLTEARARRSGRT